MNYFFLFQWPLTLYLYPEEETQVNPQYYYESEPEPLQQHNSSQYTRKSNNKHKKSRSNNTNSSNNRPSYHTHNGNNTSYNAYTDSDVRDLYTLNNAPVLSISFPPASTLVSRPRSRDPYSKKKARWEQKPKLPAIYETSESIRSRASTKSQSLAESRASVSTNGSTKSILDLFKRHDQVNSSVELPDITVPNPMLQRQIQVVLADQQEPDGPIFNKYAQSNSSYQDYEELSVKSADKEEDKSCCRWHKCWVFVFLLFLFGAIIGGVVVYLAGKYITQTFQICFVF